MENYIGIEFIKQFIAHSGKITGITISNNGLYLATCSPKDAYLKVFDIINFDMINFIKLTFIPYLTLFISSSNSMEIQIAVTELII